MKTINKILATGLFCGLVLFTGCENKSRKLLLNPINVNENHIVQPGDTYWGYAKKLQSKCPDFTKLDIREIVDYIKQDMNDGKELYSGDKINFPEYNCK